MTTLPPKFRGSKEGSHRHCSSGGLPWCKSKPPVPPLNLSCEVTLAGPPLKPDKQLFLDRFSKQPRTIPYSS